MIKSSSNVPSEDIQHAFQTLFFAVVPERKSELVELWAQYDLQFQLLEDGESPVVEGGLYKFIRYNEPFLHTVWAAAFAAWEGYSAIHTAITNNSELNLLRFKKLLNFVELIKTAPKPLDIWDPIIPMPGKLESAEIAVENRVAGELAMFATTWVMLHEIRHIRHQQEGTSSSYGTSDDKHEEEFSCDLFASKFMTEMVPLYAQEQSYPVDMLMTKRTLGIYFALFAMTLLSKDCWGASDSHPAIQNRLKKVGGLIGVPMANPIALGAFSALNIVYPNSPTWQTF